MNDDLFYHEKETKPEEKKEEYNPYMQNQSYQQFPDGYPQVPQKNGLATASLVCGLISFFCCLCPYISLICAIAGIVTSILSRKNGRMANSAIAGLVTSIIGLIITGGLILITIYVMSNPELYNQLLQQMQTIDPSLMPQ